jgi:hypothetical protein
MDQQNKIIELNFPRKLSENHAKSLQSLVTTRNDQKRFFHFPEDRKT